VSVRECVDRLPPQNPSWSCGLDLCHPAPHAPSPFRVVITPPGPCPFRHRGVPTEVAITIEGPPSARMRTAPSGLGWGDHWQRKTRQYSLVNPFVGTARATTISRSNSRPSGGSWRYPRPGMWYCHQVGGWRRRGSLGAGCRELLDLAVEVGKPIVRPWTDGGQCRERRQLKHRGESWPDANGSANEDQSHSDTDDRQDSGQSSIGAGQQRMRAARHFWI
jgi:hypothetical protein